MPPTIIKSTALYPHEGRTAIHNRHNSHSEPFEIWPDLTEGQELEVHDHQGWKWRVVVDSVVDAGFSKVKVLEGPEALPFPEVQDGKLTLPNMSGHAHVRSWERGDIVRVGEAYYKVTGAKPNRTGTTIAYTLEASTAEAYAARPGRMKYSSESTLMADFGSAVHTKTGEWLHITKTSRSSFGSAIGRSYTYWGKGRYVSADKAAKINAVHPRLLDGALAVVSGTREAKMPEGAVQLLPKTLGSLAATGTRVAVLGNEIWHERVGDPDRIDAWYPYVVKFTNAELAKRVKAYVKKVSK